MGIPRRSERAAVVALWIFAALTVALHGQVVNAGFESASLDPWITYKTGAEVLDHNAHSGTYCVAIHPHGTAFQKIEDLTEGATYILSAYVKTDAGAKALLAVQNYGGKFVCTRLPNAPDYQKITVTFTMGNDGTTAQVMLTNSSTDGTLYGDDFSIDPALAPADGSTNAAPAEASAPAAPSTNATPTDASASPPAATK